MNVSRVWKFLGLLTFISWSTFTIIFVVFAPSPSLAPSWVPSKLDKAYSESLDHRYLAALAIFLFVVIVIFGGAVIVFTISASDEEIVNPMQVVYTVDGMMNYIQPLGRFAVGAQHVHEYATMEELAETSATADIDAATNLPTEVPLMPGTIVQ